MPGDLICNVVKTVQNLDTPIIYAKYIINLTVAGDVLLLSYAQFFSLETTESSLIIVGHKDDVVVIVRFVAEGSISNLDHCRYFPTRYLISCIYYSVYLCQPFIEPG